MIDFAQVLMMNWHDCEIDGLRLENQKDCQPYRLNTERIQPRQEIARMFDEAFNRLYTQNYDVAVVINKI